MLLSTPRFPKRVIGEIESDLTEYYVDASVAAKMNEAPDAHARAGDYNGITDKNELAEKLAADQIHIDKPGEHAPPPAAPSP